MQPGRKTPATTSACDAITYTQARWEDATVAPLCSYDSVYSSNFGVVEVGIPGAAGFSIQFSAAFFVLNYLPASGPVGPLDGDLVDPSSSSSGAFGGEVLALTFNVDFSDAGVLGGNSGIRFGDLTLGNFSALPLINGLKVREFLGLVNTLLGGGSGSYSIADLAPVTAALNSSFEAGGVSSFAQEHLDNDGEWQEGDLITYSQAAWGGADLLLGNYSALYSSNFGVLEVGIPGAAGFSIQFSAAFFVLNYLPASGPVGPLEGDLVDPSSSSSGAFGGNVLARSRSTSISRTPGS